MLAEHVDVVVGELGLPLVGEKSPGLLLSEKGGGVQGAGEEDSARAAVIVVPALDVELPPNAVARSIAAVDVLLNEN